MRNNRLIALLVHATCGLICFGLSEYVTTLFIGAHDFEDTGITPRRVCGSHSM
jgi:hypothetical protein